MVSEGQDDSLRRGEDVDVTVSLTGVTLNGSETIKAFWRKKETNALELTKTGTIIDNGPPAIVTFELTSTDTLLVTVPSSDPDDASHTFSVERTDEGSKTPYSVGEWTVRNTASVGL